MDQCDRQIELDIQKVNLNHPKQASCLETISGQLDKSQKKNEKGETSFILGRRHLVVFMCFVGCSTVNFHRLVLSVAIVAMVNQTSTDYKYNNSTSSCPEQMTLQSESVYKVTGEFDWSSEVQGYILGAGFLGYILAQPPAGRLAERWGTKRTFLLGNSLAALFTFISPFVSFHSGYSALLAVQLARGLAQGLIAPSVFSMMGKWLPRTERTLLSTLVVLGFSVGAMFGSVFSGWLCDVPHLGWSYAFYISGIATLLFSAFFAVFFYETPQSHPSISKSELKHISEGDETHSGGKKLPLPWRDIITSVPVYALFLGLFGHHWSMAYFLSVHPTYLGTILHFPMTQNGIFSCLPILCKSVGGLIACSVSTWLEKRNYVGIDKLRKGCNSIGSLGYSGCLLGVYFAGCDVTSNIVLFALSNLLGGAGLAGSMIACLDMSPTFAGTLMGVVSSAASLSSFIVPVSAGEITKHKKIEEWHEVFLMCIVVVFTCGVVFQFFGSAKVQPWNYAENQDQKTPNDHEITENKVVPHCQK